MAGMGGRLVARAGLAVVAAAALLGLSSPARARTL